MVRNREEDIVIVSAVRTPIGNFSGAFATVPSHKLGEAVIRTLLQQTGVEGKDVSEIILGQVLVGNGGQNPPRQASVGAGLPVEVPAWGVSQVCGSGLRSVALAVQALQAGDSHIVIAGGQESMSLASHASFIRAGVRMGNAPLEDMMVKDGLMDVFNQYHMGITAENIASKWNITREEQDQFSALSQQKAEAAQKSGRFKDEIIPVTVPNKKGDIIIDMDEFPKHGTTAESLSRLRPAFQKDGTVTAGNASGINDGAAGVMLMVRAEADKRGLTPLARVASWAQAGVDPAIMGTGPIVAVQKALAKAGWQVSDLDLVESNEAFAAQSIAVSRELGLEMEKVNVNGGAIALGHPIGASGARILVTLLHELVKRDAKKGLATLCIGGGMGIALCVERD